LCELTKTWISSKNNQS